MTDKKKNFSDRVFNGITTWIFIALGICFLAALITKYSTEFIVAGLIGGVILLTMIVFSLRNRVRAQRAQANQP